VFDGKQRERDVTIDPSNLASLVRTLFASVPSVWLLLPLALIVLLSTIIIRLIKRRLAHIGWRLAPVVGHAVGSLRQLDRTTVGALAILCIVLAGIWVVWSTETRDLHPESGTSVPIVRAYLLSAVAQAVGGAVLLAGLFFTLRNLGIAREGQIAERFTRAIDQLGSDNLAVRLGGIFALERLAWDSEREHQTVMDVLTAYVREHAPWPPRDQSAPSLLILLLSARLPKTIPAPRESMPADIQAILTVLGRRRPRHRQRESHALSLPWTDLRSADLGEAHLEEANLVGAHLERADLGYAHLERAILVEAHLERAYLARAHLEEAYLGGAHLEEATLGGAHLEDADLGGANLERAHLGKAHLEGADLGGAVGLTLDQITSAQTDAVTQQITSAQTDAVTHLDSPLRAALDAWNAAHESPR
jgi:hypothetical protein